MSKPTREAKVTDNRIKMRNVQSVTFKYFQSKMDDMEYSKARTEIMRLLA